MLTTTVYSKLWKGKLQIFNQYCVITAHADEWFPLCSQHPGIHKLVCDIIHHSGYVHYLTQSVVCTLLLDDSCCNNENDEWAAHSDWPQFPWWWGSFWNTGQSLITLPVCVSQPHLHKPEAHQKHLMLIFTRPCTSRLTRLRHATLRNLSWVWKPNTLSLNSLWATSVQLYMIKERASLHVWPHASEISSRLQSAMKRGKNICYRLRLCRLYIKGSP